MNKHAYYSEQAAQTFGSVIWRTPWNEEIEVTSVSDDKDSYYNWPDKVYMGPVTEFVRRNKHGVQLPSWDDVDDDYDAEAEYYNEYPEDEYGDEADYDDDDDWLEDEEDYDDFQYYK